ncbi:uncharacterized protein J8A68_005412 [[Candida] subhashii]|uniref:Opaque-phase-specific protein OP4 n=1 Tax=[Candida] subhashii TaxID=561895 RepID=A0A8J5USY5_9ASCO|nr:uncharacterized protein J8A68_005412 [[Candida] subhashii]KAG7661040.1 hypothetical protein J8A68_005412 [[Candida] subhashii]
MKFTSVFILIPLFWTYVVHATYDVNYQFNFNKRADNETNTTVDATSAPLNLTTMIVQVYESGMIQELLYNFTSSHENNEALANATVAFLQNSEGATSLLSSLNITINTTQILNAVMASGLIQQVADGLLVNDTNRQALGAMVGSLLGSPDFVWVSYLIKGLGEGEQLTLDWIVDVITNSKSKANTNEDNQSDIRIARLRKRADNDTTTASNTTATSDFEGTFNAFIGNIISQVVNSDLITRTITEVLNAVTQSKIVVPLIMQSLQLPGLGDLLVTMVTTMYRGGIFNNIPLQAYFEMLKEEHILAEQTQALFTHPVYGPAIGKLFKQMEDAGVYQRIQDNMYGPHKRN